MSIETNVVLPYKETFNAGKLCFCENVYVALKIFSFVALNQTNFEFLNRPFLARKF